MEPVTLSLASDLEREPAMAESPSQGVARVSFQVADAAVTRSDDSAYRSESAAFEPQALLPLDDLANELQQADSLHHAGDVIGAHRLLSTLYWSMPERREQLQSRLETLAQTIYFSPRHFIEPHVVQQEETLFSIAREYRLTAEYLAATNRLNSSILSAGTQLKVVPGPFQAKVERSRLMLTVHAFGYYVAGFPIGIGTDAGSNTGRFLVVEKLNDPTYYGPTEIIDHDDPRNPLGEHWLGLGDANGPRAGLGLHGSINDLTLQDSSLKDSGAIRLSAADAARLFDLLIVGAEVEIAE